MAASSYPEYPAALTPDQEAYLLSNIKDWAILNGLAVRPSEDFIPKNVDPTRSTAVTAPVTLFPSLFPKACFEEASALQEAYNELYASIASNEEWLQKIVEDLVEVDDFIAKLWNVHLAVKKEGYSQSLSLGIFRSDYMVNKGLTSDISKPEIKQVEFNTIASSFGGLAAKVSSLHKHLLSISAYQSQPKPLVTKASLPPNPSITSISRGLAAAHNAYGISKHIPSLPRCILFVVQDPENNAFDQHALAASLLQNHEILTYRLPFSTILSQTMIPEEQSLRPLVYIPPHSPNTPFEVTTLYFRAGYSPHEYTSTRSWDARLHLERSAAIKCPSILTHLAGSKKVQQILATPSSTQLEHFLTAGSLYAEYVDRIRATFAAIYPLDDTSEGMKAIDIARDMNKSTGYVLKPQREGGGNNIYGTKIPLFIKSLGDDSKKYRGHILMELIQPPTLRNSILRNGQVMSGDVIGELGVYGVCLWENDEGQERPKVLENWEAGYLMRTKGRESEEGGVAAGFGAVDSVCLIDL